MKNLSAWKTSIVGLLLIAASVYYIFYMSTPEPMFYYTTLAVGVALMFAPDTLINGAKRIINRKSKEL